MRQKTKLSRFTFKPYNNAFLIGFIFMLIIETYNHIAIVNYCIPPESTLRVKSVTELISEVTRNMVRVHMWNYNFTSAGVDTLEELLTEYGGKPKRSLIVSSWRSGSSFLGDLLNSVPSTFYQYEPLIRYGEHQIRGQEYGSNATDIIKQMFECNFKGLEQWFFNYSRQIKKDLDQIKINKRLWDLCSYNEDVLCYSADFVSQMCKLFPFQSMKTVRLRLNVASRLLADDDLNLNMVLLVRDPRAVVQSRKHFCYTNECRTPQTVCSDLVNDFETAASIIKKFPNRLMVLRFEDLILNMDVTTSQLLEFLRLSRTPSVDNFLRTHTNVNNTEQFSTLRISKDIPFKWKKLMSFDDVVEIQSLEVCRDAMLKWGYVLAENAKQMLSESFQPIRPYTLVPNVYKKRKSDKYAAFSLLEESR